MFSTFSTTFLSSTPALFTESSRSVGQQWVAKRSSAVCFACSGRANYFLSSGKSTIHPEACLSLVDSCFPNLLKLARVSEFASKFIDALKVVEKYQIAVRDYSSAREVIYSNLERAKNIFCGVGSQLGSCQNVLKTPMSKSLSLWMCSKTLRLRETTILREMNPLVLEIIRALEFSGVAVPVPKQASADRYEEANFLIVEPSEAPSSNFIMPEFNTDFGFTDSPTADTSSIATNTGGTGMNLTLCFP